GVVEDKNMHLQELAKTIFAIVPSQANLSDPMFGLINKQEEVIPTEEEMNIDFESSSLVQNILIN
ncbi:13252_t:CDS:2, partial [Gigaspora margarita]